MSIGIKGRAAPNGQVIGTDDLRRFSHVPRQVGPDVLARIKALRIGQKMQDLPEELWHESFRYYVKEDPNRQGGPNLRVIRLDPTRPSLTVTGYIFNKFVHPSEDRFITPREAARLQDFGDDFLFAGTLTSVQRQVGNAVPVRLAAAVAEAVLHHARRHNRLKRFLEDGVVPSLSLFTGVGGMDLGFGRELRKRHSVGFDAVTALELDSDCCVTLQMNDLCDAVPIDIRQVGDPKRFLKKTCGDSRVPLVFGGPPCQAFSQAGRQRGHTDNRGQLIFEFVRFVEAIRPEYFVMENVSNLSGLHGGRLFHDLIRRFRSLPYEVSAYKLLAADYGTPQLRARWFMIGSPQGTPRVASPVVSHVPSDKVGAVSVFSLPPYRTVGDAFDGLPSPH